MFLFCHITIYDTHACEIFNNSYIMFLQIYESLIEKKKF